MPRQDQLTAKQKAVLEFISSFWKKNGISPSFSQIGANFGFTSKESVTKHVRQLERKGYVKQVEGKARGIVLVNQENEPPAEPKLRIPILGTVAAGNPIMSFENPDGYVVLSENIDGDRVFAVRVQGDSMTGAKIFDGDIVIVKYQDVIDHNEIGVIMLDEAFTVKRIRYINDNVILHPENVTKEDIILSSNSNARVIGKVLYVIRNP